MSRVYNNNHYHAWESEFISCELTIRRFGINKGLVDSSLGTLYNYAKNNNWLEKREKYFAKAKEKFMEKAPSITADKWMEQRRLVSDLHKQLVRATKKLDGEEDKEVIARIAKQIADTVDSLVKTESFMSGGPTDRTESKNLNLHASITDALKARDEKYGITE